MVCSSESASGEKFVELDRLPRIVERGREQDFTPQYVAADFDGARGLEELCFATTGALRLYPLSAERLAPAVKAPFAEGKYVVVGTVPAGRYPHHPRLAAGDLDGDGAAEALVLEPGGEIRAYCLLGPLALRFAEEQRGSVAAGALGKEHAAAAIGAADEDGDGRPDVWAKAADGARLVFRNRTEEAKGR